MRIIFVPIEPLEERYSANWLRWFPMEFKKANIDFHTVNPNPLSDKIRDGRFLDVSGTNYYKAMQLAEICKRFYEGDIKDSDVFLFADIWFPGIEMLAYIRDGMGRKFKITGILHAGSYDPHDFLTQKGMQWWAKPIEEGWFRFIDKFFIATEFHKRLLYTTRDMDPNKMVVTGHPTYYEQRSKLKENIVVFPHRLDQEKNPLLFERMLVSLNLHRNYDNWSFVKTKDVCTTKQEYYDMLERAKVAVSFADQETWGNAMQEAIFARCIPIVPNKLSYVEMYDPIFQFSSFNEAVDMVRQFSQGYKEYLPVMERNRDDLIKKGMQAIPNMIKECYKLVEGDNPFR